MTRQSFEFSAAPQTLVITSQDLDWKRTLEALVEQGFVNEVQARRCADEINWLMRKPKYATRQSMQIIDKIATAILMTERAEKSPKKHHQDWLSRWSWYDRIRREVYRGSDRDPGTWRMHYPPSHPMISPHMGFVGGRVHIPENRDGEEGLYVKKDRARGRGVSGSRSAKSTWERRQEYEETHKDP